MKKLLINLFCLFIKDKNARDNKRYQLRLKWGCVSLKKFTEYFCHVVPKEQGVQKYGKGVRAIVIGDSHGQAGVAPFLVGESVYDYAFGSNGLYEMWLQLQRATELCPKLKKVLLFVSYYHGGYCLAKTRQNLFCRILQRHLGFKYDFSEEQEKLFAKMDKVIDGFTLSERRVLCQGYDFPGLTISQETPKAMAGRVAKRVHLYQTYDNQWHYLDDICQFCQEKGLELVFIDTPLRADWLAVQNQLTKGEDIYARLKEYAAKYAVKFYHYQDGFEDADFADGDHLNVNGAVKLTRRLIADGVVEKE